MVDAHEEQPGTRAAVAGVSLGYKPAGSRPEIPTRPTTATVDLVRLALATRGYGPERVDVVQAILPAGGWIRVRAEGNAKLHGPQAVARDVRGLCLEWGLEVKADSAAAVLCRGTWTPTRADLRGEAARALTLWLQEQGCRPDVAVLRHEAGRTTVEAFQDRHARMASEWLADWLADAGIEAAMSAPVRHGAMWVIDVVTRRKAA